MIDVGMVGVSPGNGHPFSFSAIVNGYDPERFSESGWSVIDRYLSEADDAEDGLDGMQITHAWTQDPEVTERLCRSCKISEAADGLEEMAERVDAVIIARDDWEQHVEMAEVFLDRGLPTFVDKPLSLDPNELSMLRPHLEEGLLMSCSGMRFARELNDVRGALDSYGELRLVRGAIVLGWEKYGVHMLDAAWGVRPLRPASVTALPSDHASMAVELADGGLLQVDALGEVPPVFRLDLFGTERTSSHDITDNYSMFRRLLVHFRAMARDREPPIPPNEVFDVMRVLIAGRRSRRRGERVSVEDLDV